MDKIRYLCKNKLVTASKRLWGQTWGAHQRFFKQLIIAYKVPAIVAQSEKAIKDGCCVVIGMQSTGESSAVQAFEDRDRYILIFNLYFFIRITASIL